MRWSFAVLLVEADWFETFRVDVEAELAPQSRDAIGIGWSLESFLEGVCFLLGVDYMHGVISCICKVVKLSGSSVL